MNSATSAYTRSGGVTLRVARKFADCPSRASPVDRLVATLDYRDGDSRTWRAVVTSPSQQAHACLAMTARNGCLVEPCPAGAPSMNPLPRGTLDLAPMIQSRKARHPDVQAACPRPGRPWSTSLTRFCCRSCHHVPGSSEAEAVMSSDHSARGGWTAGVRLHPGRGPRIGGVNGGVCRLSVVGSVRRLDLAVPAGVPVAELLPDLVGLAGERVDGAALPRWVLSRAVGGDLPAGVSLAEAGVSDGAVLYLRRVDEPAVGLLGSDAVERAAAGAGADSAGADRVLLGVASACVLLVVGSLLLRDGRPVAAVLAAVLALLAVAAGRRVGSGASAVAGAAVALAAGPLLASAAAVSALGFARPAVVLAAGLGGAAVGAVLAAAAVPAARLVGCCAAAASAAGAGAVLLSFPLGAARSAGVAAVAGVLVVPGLPRLVLRACGLRPADLARAGRADPARLAGARRALPVVLAADGLLVVGAAVVLAGAGRLPGLGLAAACGLLLVLRSRDRRGPAEVLPLAVAGQVVVAAAGVGLALSRPRGLGPLLVLVAVAAVYAFAAGLPAGAVDRPRWTQRRRRVEAVALVSLAPLLAGTLGLFGVVLRLAQGAE